MAKPKNLDEAVQSLRNQLPGDVLKMIQDMPEDQTYQLHETVGRWIRNEWGLWNNGPLVKWFHEAGLGHADDMSGVILTSLWCDMHGAARNLARQIACYRQYWADMSEAVKTDGKVTLQVGGQVVQFNAAPNPTDDVK